MNAEDLFKLLDIKPGAVQTATVTITKNDEVAAPSGLNDYALELDKWDIAQGERCIKESHRIGLSQINSREAADFHALYFQQNPQLAEGSCTDPRRQEFVKTVLETPDYKALHVHTRGCLYESMIATEKLADAFSALVNRKSEKEQAQQEQRGRTQGNAAPGPMETLAAVAKAVGQAQADVDALSETKLAFGCGQDLSSGQKSDSDIAGIHRTFEEVKNNADLRKIMELAGRFRRCAQSKQRSKQDHGQDEIVGVEQDNDVSRLLPIELAKLADESFELDTMRRLVERQTSCRQFKGEQPQGLGPIIVCIDESGSMKRNSKILQAKAFALAMAWVARHQKRYCMLVSFNSNSEGTLCVLPPNKWDSAKLMDWVKGFMGGGTSMDCCLRTVPSKYYPTLPANIKGKTDMIILTDGIVPISWQLAKSFNAWKASTKCKLTTLIVGESSSGDMPDVSDTVCNIASVDTRDASVQKCLAI